MPNILFASNSVSHFPGSTIGAPLWSYDDNRVPYSIQVNPQMPVGSPNLVQSTTDEYWFHFRNGSDLWYINNDNPIIEITNALGERIFQLSYHDRNTEGYHARLTVDDTEYTAVRYIPKAENALRTYDIQLKFGGLQVEARVYVDEILLITQSYSAAGWDHPKNFILGASRSINDSFQEEFQYFSEIIVADADTRNARLDLLRPVSVGAYDNWDGPVLSLSDDDPTTGMTTVSPEQNQSTILTPYTGANNISNIVQVTTSVRGINSPSGLQHLVRMSGVDYLTSTFAVPFNKEYQITDWVENPATSLPWAATDLVNVEWGFKSKA